jgi:hypothetical protein
MGVFGWIEKRESTSPVSTPVVSACKAFDPYILLVTRACDSIVFIHQSFRERAVRLAAGFASRRRDAAGTGRARYICAAHCGQSGRALMGVLSSVFR